MVVEPFTGSIAALATLRLVVSWRGKQEEIKRREEGQQEGEGGGGWEGEKEV